MPHTRCLPVLLLVGFVSACSGSSYDTEDEQRCAEIVAAYEQMYGHRYGDQTHADFDRIVDDARPYTDDGAPSCLTLAGLVDSIESSRTPRSVPRSLDPDVIAQRDLSTGAKIGLGVAVILALVSFAASIWLLIVAFQESVWWGLGCFFIPGVTLVFAAMHWGTAKVPFSVTVGTQLAAVLFVFLAIV